MWSNFPMGKTSTCADTSGARVLRSSTSRTAKHRHRFSCLSCFVLGAPADPSPMPVSQRPVSAPRYRRHLRLRRAWGPTPRWEAASAQSGSFARLRRARKPTAPSATKLVGATFRLKTRAKRGTMVWAANHAVERGHGTSWYSSYRQHRAMCELQSVLCGARLGA